MPPALWTLLRLHFKGVLRRMLRGVRTPRGAIFLLLGVLVTILWLGGMVYGTAKRPPASPETVRTVAPFAILSFCLGNLLTSTGDNAVTYTPAEVDFLFCGPFSRKSLLRYKIIKTGIGTIISACFFTILLRRYSQWWVACAVGAWLTIQFMQLFAMCVMMIGQTVGERAFSAARRGLLIAVLAMAAVLIVPKLTSGMRQGPMELARAVHASLGGRILLAPFDVFARTLTANNSPELAEWAILALLIDLFMLALATSLDANYLETAAGVSQRRYERSRRLRRGGIGPAVGIGGARLRIHPLPWLGGAGPIAWRQLTGAIRGSRRLLIMVIIAAIVVGSAASRAGDRTTVLSGMIGVAVWMNLFFVSTLKFDFHDDLDRLDLLRSLPIRPSAVAAGELFAPVVALGILQALLLITCAVMVKESRPYLPVIAVYALPVNVLMVGIENILFLMFPLRAAGLIAGDMQLFGRQMVVFLLKMFLMLAGLGIAAIIGTVGYIAGRLSWTAFGITAWFGLCAVSLATIPFLARVYARFDPSVDTPA